jgi:4-methylaminobutanoate oxidase (formaldehyde-forming)
LFPLARTDDLLAGFYVPTDGRVNPVDVTMSLARGARQRGVTIVEGVAARRVSVTDGRVAAVVTDAGDIECEYVVNCTGMWARQLGEANGVSIPLQAAEHYYLITEPMPGVSADWPVLEDPSRHGYYREEGGGIMVGLFEPVCAPWALDGIPEGFSFGRIEPDWDRMAPFVEAAMGRVPDAAHAGVRTFFCGPESFTPDLSPMVGEVPGIARYFVAAGMNSVGIITGGGLGRLLAHWITTGHPDMDVTAMDVQRAQTGQVHRRYRAERTVETLGMVYQTHFPGRSMSSARGVRRSPLHDRLGSAGAYFRDVSGWEAADWFAPNPALARIDELTWGRQSWFPYWAEEHAAVRTGVGVMDMSFMAKFLVQGPEAADVLDWVSANRVAGPVGRVTYTQWLNEAGTIEADLTVTRLAEDRFLVVASDTAHGHVAEWLRRHARGRSVVVTDVTSGLSQLNVQGPRSRALLQSLTTADLANEAFPFRTARPIDLGFAEALCLRITYVGELGYELFVPTEMAVYAYEELLRVGEQHGLRHVGLKALSSLRLEKGYRDYGHDIDNTDTVTGAGLGFAVAWDKQFLGREAALRERDRGVPRSRLVQVRVLDPDPLMHHAEVVLRDGREVGYVRAASYGHTLGGAVGLAMVAAEEPVTSEWLAAGDWSVDIAGTRYPADVADRPMYDPQGARIRE